MNPARTTRFLSALNIRPDEAGPISLFAALYFALSSAFLFLQAVTFGLFIQEFGSQNLPFAYLTIAIFASSIAYLFLRLGEQIPLERLVTINLVFSTIVFFIYRVGLLSPFRNQVIFFLPLWFQTMINLANLAVWPLAGSTFDLRQAKRLFGIIGLGGWLSNVIGGVIVAPAIAWLGLDNLLLVSAGWLLIALLVFALIARGKPGLRRTGGSASPRTAVVSPG